MAATGATMSSVYVNLEEGCPPVTSHGTSRPEHIGPYRIEQKLGAGGFGAVYEALDTRCGRKVAVKVLHRELAERRDHLLRFEREVRALGRVHHPGIAQVLDVGEDWFALELLHGQDLRGRLRDAGRLSLDETLGVLGPLAEALTAAHDKGVIHRDLKASNVFLDRRRVVLLDFGVAKLLDETGPQLTTSRVIVGSPACMAPEQILGQGVDARTDVYGLGVLAYHMLTGVPPFSHEHPTMVQEMHLLRPAPLVSRRVPVPEELDRAIARAMAKEPRDRQQSVADLARELRARPVAAAADQAEALAVHIDAEDDVLDETVRTLTSQGMEIAFEAGNAVTLLLGLPAEREEHRQRRRRTLAMVGNRGPRAAVYVGAGATSTLLRLGSWIPEQPARGVLAMPAVIEGLGVRTEPVAGTQLLRLVQS